LKQKNINNNQINFDTPSKIRKLNKYSCGVKTLESLFLDKLRQGFESIVLRANTILAKENEKNEAKKYYAICKMMEFARKIKKKAIEKWRNCNSFEENIENLPKKSKMLPKLSKLWFILIKLRKNVVMKNFIKWKMMPGKQKSHKKHKKHEKHEENEIISENVSEDEEIAGILRPNASGKIKPVIFEETINQNTDKIFNLLKPQIGIKQNNEKEISELKKKISEYCVDMAIDFFNTFINQKY